MTTFDNATAHATQWLSHVSDLNARYRAGQITSSVPPGLHQGDATLDELIALHFPASKAALDAAARSLFFSLPVAFDPSESVGPYLAVTDRDASGEPYRFLDMGALIATQAFGENDPAVVRAILEALPFVASRYAHSEYQTVLSLRLKAELNRIAPSGTPRHFVVNTGAEAVENAIKSVLMNRVMTTADREGGFIVSFEGAFHGRTLGALAVTHRKRARLGFPTFDWPRIPFPVEDAGAPKLTARREESCLKQLWDLLVSGRLPRAEKSRDTYRREIDAVDEFLAQPGSDLDAFVTSQRTALTADVIRRSRRVAAVLVEPIQGEGGVRVASARFMRRLRLLTKIYDVPLIFDEVQTGWGMTGRMWAHELFDLPSPPDLVTWAKKAQNGVLFVSEALATFFQEEKKFNTTWEGDSVGMVRLLSLMDKLDLEQVRRTGERARAGLQALARDYREIVKNVRGAGVMLGFDLARADLSEAVLDRAFRRGLVLLGAGERTIRFYPRFDTEPAAIDEALADPPRGDRGHRRRPRFRGNRAAGQDACRHPGDSDGHGGRRRPHPGDVRAAQGAGAGRRAGALRFRGVPARRAARGSASAAAVSDCHARDHRGQSAGDRPGAPRSRVGSSGRLRNRQRPREPRRRRHHRGSARG